MNLYPEVVYGLLFRFVFHIDQIPYHVIGGGVLGFMKIQTETGDNVGSFPFDADMTLNTIVNLTTLLVKDYELRINRNG